MCGHKTRLGAREFYPISSKAGVCAAAEPGSGTESFEIAGSCFGCFFFPASGWRGGGEGCEKARGDSGYFFDGGEEGGFVGLGGFVEAADLSDELQGRGMDFLVGDRRVEVEEHFDVPAHRGRSIV